jgi:hypothetical protein
MQRITGADAQLRIPPGGTRWAVCSCAPENLRARALPFFVPARSARFAALPAEVAHVLVWPRRSRRLLCRLRRLHHENGGPRAFCHHHPQGVPAPDGWTGMCVCVCVCVYVCVYVYIYIGMCVRAYKRYTSVKGE